MAILSWSRKGRSACLCGVFLAGAGGLSGCADSSGGDVADMLAAPSPPDSGLSGPRMTTVSLSPNQSVIWFDDAAYSASLHKLLVPGANTGKLFLIDPDTLAVSSIPGFTNPASMAGGSPTAKGGITSIAEGNNLLYLGNQTDKKLYVVDPGTQSIVTSVPLAGNPDYVRYAAATSEIWVSEPDDQMKIEIFSLKANPRKPQHSSFVPIAGGPQGLAIDNTRKVAYSTSGMNSVTQVIDLAKRKVIGSWASGCQDPKGIVADEADGLAFVGCGEGGVAAVDVAQGKMVSRLETPDKVDSLGYSPMLRHVYLPGTKLTVGGVSASGMLTQLSTVAVSVGSTKHALADDSGHAWMVQPNSGQLLRIDDDNMPKQ